LQSGIEAVEPLLDQRLLGPDRRLFSSQLMDDAH
jgi:hypothetical protein